MAKTEFTEDELKSHLFVEFVKREDGPLAGRTDFHGFFTDEALMRRRQSVFRGDSGRMSDYLFSLAELFLQSENQAMPAPDKAPLYDHEAGCAINRGVLHCDCAFGRQFELHQRGEI